MAAPLDETGGGKSLFDELSEIEGKIADDDGWPTAVQLRVEMEDSPTRSIKDKTDNVQKKEREQLPSRYIRKSAVTVAVAVFSLSFSYL